ncbi:hypothetical protein ACR722_13455, partial [Listeria monocytogenes]
GPKKKFLTVNIANLNAMKQNPEVLFQ